MTDETGRGRSLMAPILASVFVGALVGSAGVGIPLFMKARELEAQLAALTVTNTALQGERDSTRLALANAQQQILAERDSKQVAIAAAEQELQQQRALTEELAKPTLPLQLSVRRGWVDAGYVLTLRNVSLEELAVMAKFESPGGGTAQKRIVVPASGIREVGETEGWAFSSRDTVTLSSAGYQDTIYMVPVY